MEMSNLSDPIIRLRIEPQSGVSFLIKRGQIIRVIDVEGEQVADLFCVSEDDIEEFLSSGHTIDYNSKIYLSQGDVLYSNRSNLMLKIVEDRVGRHVMLYAPCSQKMFEKSYGVAEPHPNCLDNLVTNLERYGIKESQLTVPLNLFMSTSISEKGVIAIEPPKSKAGDYILLQAEMDMIVGISACSAGACNNYKWTPIDIEIYEAE